MKKYISLCLAVVSAALVQPRELSAKEISVPLSDISVSRRGPDLVVAFEVDSRNANPGRDREVVITPVVRSVSGTDSVELPVMRLAGRNRYFSHLRNEDLAKGETMCLATSREPVTYRAEVPFAKWMERSTVSFRREVGNCCDPLVPIADTPVAEIDYTVPPFTVSPQFVSLTGDSTIERSAEGRAFIDFVVNQTDIREGYRKNNIELPKIIASIDKVKNDPDAIITRITIKGYASPEGSYSNNVRLAMGRTAALKEYVRDHYKFNPEIMSTDYEPEDWEGLRRWLETCTLPHRDEILEIANSSLEPDPRDQEIKRRYPSEYKIIYDSIYPALRHSDYTVKYRIRTYVDLDELKRIYASNPSNLRPVDFERIAQSYPAGSDKREKVYLKALEYYKYDPQVNLNAASILLSRGDITGALPLINRAGQSPEAIYTRGEYAAMTGDYTLAADLLEEAVRMGFEPAAPELEKVRAVLSRSPIRYIK